MLTNQKISIKKKEGWRKNKMKQDPIETKKLREALYSFVDPYDGLHKAQI